MQTPLAAGAKCMLSELPVYPLRVASHGAQNPWQIFRHRLAPFQSAENLTGAFLVATRIYNLQRQD